MNNHFRQFDIKNKIKKVVEGMGSKLSDKIVFVGGAVVSFYSTSENIIDSRPTKDIDCVIQLTSRLSYNALEQELRKKGFENDLSQKAPVCRWIYENIVVDMVGYIMKNSLDCL